jgi:hypothetical protein
LAEKNITGIFLYSKIKSRGLRLTGNHLSKQGLAQLTNAQQNGISPATAISWEISTFNHPILYVEVV